MDRFFLTLTGSPSLSKPFSMEDLLNVMTTSIVKKEISV